MHITTKDHSGCLPAPIRMTLNDPESAIHLKVRLVDGTLDVRSTLWLSNSTIRIGVARGAEGQWAGGPSPSTWAADALFLCGS